MYLANAQFKGTTVLATSEIIQWISFADNQLLPSVISWTFSLTKKSKGSNSDVAKEDLLQSLKGLDKILLSKTYFVGERISMADIALFTTLQPLYSNQESLEAAKKNRNVTRWYRTIEGMLKEKKLIE